MSPKIKEQIAKLIRESRNQAITEGESNPFVKELADSPTGINKRSLTTSLGYKYEQIAKLIAEESGYNANTQEDTEGVVDKAKLEVITNIRHEFRKTGQVKSPDWQSEVERLLNASGGEKKHIEVRSDLQVSDGEQRYTFSIKSPKPNLDQLVQAKEDLLKLKAINPSINPKFAFHHNPFGTNVEEYNHNFTTNVFNLYGKPLLVGKDFWNFLGGEGTYCELLEIFKDVGSRTPKKLNV